MNSKKIIIYVMLTFPSLLYTAESDQQNETHFKFLYAPWRNSYITNSHQKTTTCPFCSQYAEKQDEKNLILKRFKHCFVMLNLYPYNTGHLLIVITRHVAKLCELQSEERTEIMEVIVLCQQLLEKTVKVEGFNIGINQGAVAGAGVPDHLHIHLLPRFSGDTGVLTTISSTNVISCNLNELYHALKRNLSD